MQTSRCFIKLTSSAAALASAIVAVPVCAQDSTEAVKNTVGEIVVTAQRRATSAQKTPITLSAFGGEALQQSLTDEVTDLAARVPGLSIGQETGVARVTIRGVGFQSFTPGTDPSVAFNMDGVYLARPAAATAAFYDIERIEILRGPQVTLYGRNATGGAVNLITKDPTFETDGEVSLSLANYGSVEAFAAIGGPLSDKVAARIAVSTADRDGYGKNLFTGDDINDLHTRAGRVKVLFKPSNRASILIAADYFRERDNNYAYTNFGAGTPVVPVGQAAGATRAPNLRDVSNDVTTLNRREYYGFAATGTLQFENVELKSRSSARRTKWRTVNDLDGYALPVLGPFSQEEDSKEIFQELQAVAKVGWADLVGGLTYFHEKVSGGLATIINFDPLNPANIPLAFGGTIKTDAYAAFADATFHVSDQLSVTAGLRGTYEKKKIDEYVTLFGTRRGRNDADWSDIIPKVGVSYQADNFLAYASYSEGFKSGSFNNGNLQPAFNPEQIKSYEVGFKSSLLNRALRLNVSAYHYDFADLQVGRIVDNALLVENAAGAKIDGVEAELVATLADSFSLDLSSSLMDAKFTDFITEDNTGQITGPLDLSGKRLPQAPKFSLFAGATYKAPVSTTLSLSLRGEVQHQGRTYFTAYNRAGESEGKRTKVNLFATLASESGWEATAFVRNVFDKDYISSNFISTVLAGYVRDGFLEPPRTFGIRVRRTF